MDLESLVAIDVHAHAEVSSRGGASLDDTLNDASAAYFKVDRSPPSTPSGAGRVWRRRARWPSATA